MAIALKSTGIRQVKNSLAKWLITLGGISVLFTLVLIHHCLPLLTSLTPSDSSKASENYTNRCMSFEKKSRLERNHSKKRTNITT